MKAKVKKSKKGILSKKTAIYFPSGFDDSRTIKTNEYYSKKGKKYLRWSLVWVCDPCIVGHTILKGKDGILLTVLSESFEIPKREKIGKLKKTKS